MSATRWETTTTAVLERVGRATIALLDDADPGPASRSDGISAGPVVLVGGMAATGSAEPSPAETAAVASGAVRSARCPTETSTFSAAGSWLDCHGTAASRRL